MSKVMPIHFAEAELAKNVKESPPGSNRGERIDVYNASLGLYAQPWCASFVYWCYKASALARGIQNPLPKSGYCPYLQDWSRNQKKRVGQPKRGDIFLVLDSSGTAIHTGFVDSAEYPSGVGLGWRPEQIWTIEGNTNNNGSNEGLYLMRRKRSTHNLIFFRV